MTNVMTIYKVCLDFECGINRLHILASYLYLLTLKHKYKFICHIDALKISHIKVYFTHNVCELFLLIGLFYIMLYKTSTLMFISLNFNVLLDAFKCFSYFWESKCWIKIWILIPANGFYLQYTKAMYIYQFYSAFTHMYLGSTQPLAEISTRNISWG